MGPAVGTQVFAYNYEFVVESTNINAQNGHGAVIFLMGIILIGRKADIGKCYFDTCKRDFTQAWPIRPFIRSISQ